MATLASPTRQFTLLKSIGVSVSILALLLLTAWLGYRADKALGHGPLPSGIAPSAAYVITMLTALLSILTVAAIMTGISYLRDNARRFSWMPAVIAGLPSLIVLLTPMKRFGYPAWGSLPDFLASPVGHLVMGTGFALVIFSAVDVRSLFSRSAPPQRRAIASATNGTENGAVAGVAARGLPGQFTAPAWRAHWNMQEEARRFNHTAIGSEHLFLALIRDRESVGVKALLSLGVDLDRARIQLENDMTRRGSVYAGGTGLSRRAQAAIELAAKMAKEARQAQVGTAHLIMALVNQPEDSVARVLNEMGATSDRLATELRRIGPQTEEIGKARV